MWYVYALYNAENGKIYIGETGDIKRRVREHNRKRGNHYTAKISGEWKVIYTEEVLNRVQALVRERQLKSYQGREFIKKHIPR